MNGLRAFLRGVARAFDLFGVLGPRLEDVRRPGETGARADARALASDWWAVGDDLRAAMGRTDQEESGLPNRPRQGLAQVRKRPRKPESHRTIKKP